MYDPHLEFTGTLDKKVTFGIWTKKFVTLKGLTLVVSDVEKGPAIATLELQALTRVDGDTTAMQFHAKGQEIILRGSDQRIADYWWDLVTQALVHHKLLKPRSAGLPPIDPRFNLKFAEIPSEFVQKFEKLDKCVLYWFSPVKKFGAVSMITRRHVVEDRVGACGDKAFYITKMNGDLTRCVKILNLKKLYTNVQAKTDPKEENFIVFKALPPDFDLFLASPTVDVLIKVLESLYSYYTKGTSLEVVHIKSIADVELQLERPANFNQTMVVPTSKDQLKKALDAFGKKNGIKFTDSGVEAASATGLKSPSLSSAGAASGGTPKGSFAGTDLPSALDNASLSSNQDSAGLPPTDPLAVFLSMIGLGRIYLSLYRQSIDLDIMECMDESDMSGFGGVSQQEAASMKASLSDPTFMAKVRAKVDEARKNAKWTSTSTPSAAGQSSGSKPLAASPAASTPSPKPSVAHMPIILDDDDDLDVFPAGQLTSSTKSSVFEFNDSDDDLDVAPAPPPKKAAAQAPINLDDDDDL